MAARATAGPTAPSATYRLQLSADFGFAAAAAQADYLRDLGVSHLYTSPLLAAGPGSRHGYDVVDHARVADDLGGAEGRRALARRLRELDLGLVVDIVPNHMSIAVPELNRWWWDVLTYGPSSRFARFFDIDWSRGRLVLPVLGAGPSELDELEVVDDELRYHDRRFPVAPGPAGGPAREVHSRQHYELVGWRRGDSEPNYRRFFDVTTLAGLRAEDPKVFDATHREVLGWVAAGEVSGLRIDHIDGLADPAGYLDRLRAAAPAAWLVVEKILQPEEQLPAAWPCAGSTGYDALREVCGLFVDPAAEPAFTAAYAVLTGERRAFPELAHDLKLLIATTVLRAELARLARLLPGVPDALDALAEIAACLPVYRTYLPDGLPTLHAAVAEARRRRPDLGASVAAAARDLPAAGTELATRFQQTSGMVMAKGVEDTAFYRYHRFVALNEVGGDPAVFGVPPEQFHAACARRQAAWPAGMTALSTHDTKRSEDVRARLAVLAELPAEWERAVRGWSRQRRAPDPNLGYLAWQTLVGAWPLPRERALAYLEKAAREAKEHTSWTDPDADYDRRLRRFVDDVYADPELCSAVGAFAARLTPPGWSNSLGQKLVQLTMPGVPDIYQGTELWDLSLVDPDNRRPVDIAVRRALLARIDGGWRPPVDESGAAKLLVVARALRTRRDRPAAFAGSYDPLLAEGHAAGHAVAFVRGGEAVTVATRLPVGLHRRGGWRDTVLELPPGRWTDVLSGAAYAGGPASVGTLLARYPVALALRDG